jgi:ankyrin repeat protein
MKALRKRIVWISFTMVFLVVVIGTWYNRKLRQQWLDLALIAAIQKNDTQTAIALLDLGADANATDKPSTPISLKGLLADCWHGLKGNKPPRDARVYCPAIVLPYQGIRRNPVDNAGLINTFLKYGANPYARDANENTVLHYAACWHCTETVRTLLEHRLNPNVKNWNGTTPVMYANDDCARLLVEHGADVNERNDEGRTCLMVNHNPDTYQMLLDHQADVNLKDNRGQTALIHLIMEHLSVAKVNVFIRNGAKVSIKDNNGKTALDYAKEYRHTSRVLIRLLEERLNQEQRE